MTPVCQSLDILQGEKKAFLGILLPTVTATMKMLADMNEDSSIIMTKPLLKALLNGFMKRFAHLFGDMDYLIASATHPHFKLTWLKSVDRKIIPDADATATQIKDKVRSFILSEANSMPKEELSSGEDSSMEGVDFFAALRDDARPSHAHFRHNNYEVDLERYFCELPVKSSKGLRRDMFPNDLIYRTFIKYNTAVPSSASVERLFSLGKDILRPKRCGLSDSLFNMLVFLHD